MKMTMPHLGAVFATIAGVMAIMLHSSIHKIEEGHLAVYYRYHNTDPLSLTETAPCCYMAYGYMYEACFLIMIININRAWIWKKYPGRLGNGASNLFFQREERPLPHTFHFKIFHSGSKHGLPSVHICTN